MRMAGIAFVLSLFLVIAASSNSMQQVVENPEKPLAKNAGRVLELKEIWRITDEVGKFYFKRPTDLRVAADGSVYVADDSEILRFSPQGVFVRNLYKPGQGPGEFSSDAPAFTIREKELILYDFMARNIVVLDLDGNLFRQFRIETGPFGGFYGFFGDRLIFHSEIYPPAAERKPGRQNMPVKIKSVGMDGKAEKNHGSFMEDMVISGNRFTTWTGYHAVLDEAKGRFFVSATREYGVEVIELASGRTSRVLRRKYQSLPYRERGWEESFYKANNVPKIRIERDVTGLFWTGESLWVRTSTKKTEAGDLFDVFDVEGRFLDSFFLGAGRSLIRVAGDDVYVTEKNADESLALVKYRIIEEERR